jgi:hypothetical protein
MADSEKDKRKHTRLRVQFVAEYSLDGKKLFSGKTRDISFSGVYMYCRNAGEASVGANGRLKIILQAGGKGNSIDIAGQIVRIDGEGIGIKLLSINMDDYQKFRNLMLYNNPHPDILIEELKKDPGLDIN